MRLIVYFGYTYVPHARQSKLRVIITARTKRLRAKKPSTNTLRVVF